MQKMRLNDEFMANLDNFDYNARFARAQLREYGLHLVSIDVTKRVARFSEFPIAEPLATWKPLCRLAENAGEGAVRQEAERLAALERASIVGLDVVGNRVKLSPTVPVIDERVTRKIVKRRSTTPENVKVAPAWSEEAPGRLETLTVSTDAVNPDVDKAMQDWQNIVGEMPGGSNGWRIRDDRQTEETLLTWGPVRSLPATVPLMSILPSQYDRGNWRRIPLGRDSSGKVVYWEPSEIPHTLIAGPTGAGKSIQLSSLLAAWVAHGGRYVVIDPVRFAADFAAVRDGASAWATTLADAAEVLSELWAEGQRRMQLWLERDLSKWNDLPQEVIEAENVWPILVVIDEYMALVTDDPEQKALGADNPLFIEAQEANRHKAVIRAMVDKIAKVLRPAGIHLAIATQRPDVGEKTLAGSTRAQLSNTIQLQAPGRTLDASTLGMTMKGDDMQAARDEFRALDDNVSKGLAVVSAEGAITGYRVAYAEIAEIPALLRSIGVPLTPPPVLFGSAARAKWAPKPSTPQPVAVAPLAPAPQRPVTPELFPELFPDAEPAPQPPAEDEWF